MTKKDFCTLKIENHLFKVFLPSGTEIPTVWFMAGFYYPAEKSKIAREIGDFVGVRIIVDGDDERFEFGQRIKFLGEEIPGEFGYYPDYHEGALITLQCKI